MFGMLEWNASYGRFLFVLCTAGQADLIVDCHSTRHVATPSWGRLEADLGPTWARLAADLGPT